MKNGIMKNALIYQLTQQAKDYVDALVLKAADHTYEPCKPSQAMSVGFVPVFTDGPMVYEQKDFCLVRVKKQTKSLPASGINEILDEKVAEIEKNEARKVYRKERLALKDDIIQEKLPNVLPTSETIFAYIDYRLNMVIVDAGAEAKADIVIHLIRESIGSFPVIIPDVANAPSSVMTRWITDRDAQFFEFGRDVLLQEAIEGGATLKVTDDDLFSECIEAAINEGKQVQSIALSYDHSVRFDLHSQYKLKRIGLFDEIELPDDPDEASEFDAQIFIMVEQLFELIPKVGQAFGGFMEQEFMKLS